MIHFTQMISQQPHSLGFVKYKSCDFGKYFLKTMIWAMPDYSKLAVNLGLF